MKTYVTFGGNHIHRIGGSTFDCDCVAIVDGNRDKVFKIFGRKFSFEHSEEEWDENSMIYYPRGYIYVRE